VHRYGFFVGLQILYQRSDNDSVIRTAIQLAIDCDDLPSLDDIIQRHINVTGYASHRTYLYHNILTPFVAIEPHSHLV
jgi:hypothetical protein